MQNKRHTKKYHGSCHCGKINWFANYQPEFLVECNCSLCTKIGALWSHAECNLIDLNYSNDDVNAYVQGDKTLKAISCKYCGCTTHWESISPQQNGRMGVNFRMLDRDVLEAFVVRKINGADDSFEFID